MVPSLQILRSPIYLFMFGVILVSLLMIASFLWYMVSLRNKNARLAARWRELEQRWKTSVLACMMGDETVEKVHGKIMPGENLYFIDFVRRFAQKVRGIELDRMQDLVRPFLDTVATRLSTDDEHIRSRAVQTLSVLGIFNYQDMVIPLLNDPSPLVAMIAARAIISTLHPDKSKAVLSVMNRFQNWSRGYMANLLAMAGPGMSPYLREALEDLNRPDQERVIVADALRFLNDVPSADIVARLLSKGTGRELGATCLRILGSLGGPQHLDVIREQCASEDAIIRVQAIRSLGAHATTEDFKILEKALNDDSSWVALQAARSLRQVAGEAHLKALASEYGDKLNLLQQVMAEA